MAKVIAIVNKKGLDKKLAKSGSVSRKTKTAIVSKVKKPIADANRAILRKFLEDKITQEILAGVNSSNVSGTLGGEGNLFSFIGFEDGSDPIAPILDLITNSIKISSINKTSFSQATFRITIKTPSKEEIFEATPLPWAVGKSWAEGIERGMSGLGYYLYKEKGFRGSRSGKAIQLETKIRAGGFSNKKYISALLRDISVYLTKEMRRSFK